MPSYVEVVPYFVASSLPMSSLLLFADAVPCVVPTCVLLLRYVPHSILSVKSAGSPVFGNARRGQAGKWIRLRYGMKSLVYTDLRSKILVLDSRAGRIRL